MDEQAYDEIFLEWNEEQDFYIQAFSLVSRRRKVSFSQRTEILQQICAEEYDDVSKRADLSGIQESCSIRNVLRSRRIANLLITDKGEVNVQALSKIIGYLKEHLYSLGPNRGDDAYRQEHILKVLQSLQSNKDLMIHIKTVSKPYANKLAEQLIRDTLILPSGTLLTDAHAKKAVLAAWMCYLRQNVGSCFATAPAIIVHDELPELFFNDMKELLATGRLKRTFGGIEYSVPISQSWGAGDLKKPFYVRTGDPSEQANIGFSPGLISAFEAVKLIDPEASLHDQIARCQFLIINALRLHESESSSYRVVTAEQLIRRVLLDHFKITENDLEEYAQRPQGVIQSGLLMQYSKIEKSKGQICLDFNHDFDLACSAFKALADNALLKAWEFTLASFSETKARFARWNLYSSLGLGAEEPGGIGATLYEIIKRKLDECNHKVHETQYEYETIYTQLKTLESRIRHAASEKEAQWIKIEYESKRNEFYTLEDMRNDAHRKAEKFSNLFNVLIEEYDRLFPQYFQEVYDADMHDVFAGPYDDSPAGYRLLYKHGRSNTSQWSRIKTPNQFVDYLASFFITTENEVSRSTHLEGLETDLSEIVTAIVTQVRTTEFLESSFYRMAKAHNTPFVRDPLNNLDKIEKKPWAYTSGGTMSTLVSCYFKREEKPSAAERWVESPLELLVFIIDTLKQIPPRFMEEFAANSKKSMLMHSPTHAFLLKPGHQQFRETWQNDAFTYTWARDHIVLPMQHFVNNLSLNKESMAFFIQHFAKQVPEDFRYLFLKTFEKIYGEMSPREFREYVLDQISHERGLRGRGVPILRGEDIDAALYTFLPTIMPGDLKEKMNELFSNTTLIEESIQARAFQLYDRFSHLFLKDPVISSRKFQGIVKGLLCLSNMDTSSQHNVHEIIATLCRKIGMSMPSPILFADTNWVKDQFGFIVNPGTGQFELWRFSENGTIGYPMNTWKEWLNGSRKDITWGIYNKPHEYGL